jgi:hypothetical protein
LESSSPQLDKPGRRWAWRLRIAFSAVCGIVCLLLIVLWVRSYSWGDTISGDYQDDSFSLESEFGEIFVAFPNQWHLTLPPEWEYRRKEADESYTDSFTPFFYIDVDGGWCFILPYWIPTTLLGFAAAITAIPRHIWLRSRFSLRTLLIAITILALALGLIIAKTR